MSLLFSSVFFRFLPFSSVFFRFLPLFSVFFLFFCFLPFFSVSFSEKKRGDTVRETPFAKPQDLRPIFKNVQTVKTSQRIERNLGLRFESCDFRSLRIGAIRSAANCARRFGTSKYRAERPGKRCSGEPALDFFWGSPRENWGNYP